VFWLTSDHAREVIRFDVENLSAELPSTKRILSFDIWPDPLPRTTTRKLKRFEIQRRVQAGERSSERTAGAERTSALAEPEGGGLTNDAEPTADEALWLSEPDVQRALAIIRSASKSQKPVQPSSNLELDLGFDSMERVELVVSLEREFRVDVEDKVISQVYTVRELVDTMLHAHETASSTASGTGANAAEPTEGSRTTSSQQPQSAAAGWEAVLSADPTGDADAAAINRTLHTSVVFTFFWFVLAKAALLVVRIFFGLSVSGRERLPRKGPFILSPNHQSYLDGPVVAGLMPWRLFKDMFYVGTSEIFGRQIAFGLLYRLGRTLKLVPVDPDSNLVNAMRAGAYGLRQGDILTLYPEGERSIDGTPKRFKKGAAILSTHLQVPIMPVALEGFYQAWPRGKAFPRRAHLRVRFGDPIEPVPASSSIDSARLIDPDAPSRPQSVEESYKQLTEKLRNTVVEMWQSLREKQHEPEPVTAGD
jgi:long-chain acyl-CoA synthetase